MKITIDTKEDSSADIRKVIALLSKMIEDPGHHSNIFEDSSPGLGASETPGSESAAGNAFANMFGDNSVPIEENKEEQKEEKEGIPEVMEY
jgi:hypothetical protein